MIYQNEATLLFIIYQFITLFTEIISAQDASITLMYKNEICPFQKFRNTYQTCDNCHPLCSGCYGENSYQCNNCLGYIHQMNCVDKCPKNYFSDENRECRTCNILYCSICQDIYICNTCEDNFDLADFGTSCKQKDSKDLFAYRDESSQLTEYTQSCQNKGYQLNGQLKICESIPKCPIHNEIIFKQYSCFQEKEKGIETTMIDNDRIILYNINQAMLFEYSTFKYIKEIYLENMKDSIISIQFIKQVVFIIYENAIKFYNSKTFLLENTFNLPSTIKNNQYSQFIFLNNTYCFMTMNQKFDAVSIFDYTNEVKLAEFQPGNRIEKILYIQNNQIIAILTVLNMVIYNVEFQKQNIFAYTKFWDNKMYGQYEFSTMRLNYFYNSQNKPHLIVETSYLLCIANILEKFYVEDYYEAPVSDSNFLPQQKLLFIKQNAMIITYDLKNIIKGSSLIRFKNTTMTGSNLLISSTNKYIYLTSTENNYSEIFLYDLKFNLITTGKIVNLYGRPVKFYPLQECIQFSKLDNNTCDPNSVLALSVENNLLFIQDFDIKKVVFENCMSQSNSYLQQTSKQLVDQEKDNLRGLDFVVSINIYSRLTFFILKLGIARQSIEINDPYLQNLSIDNINNISIFIDDQLRLVKVLGILKVEDKQKIKLAITFRYNDFKIINIEKYLSIEYIQRDVFLGVNLNQTRKKLFRNYIGYNNTISLPYYEFMTTSTFKYLMRQGNNIIYSDKSQIAFLWIIDVNTLTLVNYITISQKNQFVDQWQFVFGFFPNNDMFIAYNSTQKLTYQISSSQIKINEIKFNYVPSRSFIDSYTNTLIIEEQDIRNAFNFTRFYHIFDIYTQKRVVTIQPLISTNDTIEEDWVVYYGGNLQLTFLDITDKLKIFLLFQITTWKNYPETKNITAPHITKIHYVVTYAYIIPLKYVMILSKEIFKFSRALYLSNEITNDFSVNQFFYISLLDSSQQINMLCQKECQSNQIKIRKNLILYKNLIFPDVSGMLKLEFKKLELFIQEEVKQYLKVMLLDERQLILLIYQLIQSGSDQTPPLIIELYSYPNFKIFTSIKIKNPCEYNLFQIIKKRGIIITCSEDQTTIYGIYTLKEKEKSEFTGFSHFQCCDDQGHKPNCLIKYALYSEKYSIVYFNKCGVLDYNKNIFYKNPDILIGNFNLSYYNTTQKKYIPSEQPTHFLETSKYLYISMENEILCIQKDQEYELKRKQNPSNELRPNFEKNFIVFKLNFNSVSKILVQDYEFNPLQQFESSDIHYQFNSTYYYDCPEQSMLFLIYNFKIEGFSYPFKLGSKDPQFLFKTKDYQVCACTDKYLVIQIVTDKNSVNGPGEKVLYLQFIDVKNNKIYKEIVLYKQNYLIDYDSLAKNPLYIKEKAVLLLSNMLISLQSDFFSVIPQRNLLYDKQFDFAIIAELKDKQYFQIMDFSTIFPFKQEYYEITSSLQVSGFLIPKSNNNYTQEQIQNKLLIQGSYWNQTKRSFIVYYQNSKQVIQFYDYEENKRIELKVQIPDLPNLQNYVMQIDLFQDNERFDKIIFRGIISDKIVFFNFLRIISIISINEFHELYLLSYFAEKDNQIYFLNFTKQYNSTQQGQNDSNQQDPNQINQDDFQIQMNSAPIIIPKNIQEKLGIISQVRLFDRNRYIAFIDNINNLVLYDNKQQKTKMITLDFKYSQLNEFHFKNYVDSFTIFISYKNDSVVLYDSFLNKVVDLTGFLGSVKYSFIDPHFQQIYFSDYYFIYAFKYDKIKFDGTPTLIIKKDEGNSTYYLDQTPLQTRGNYVMKKISYDNFAIISQSNCHIFNVTNKRLVLTSRIVNEDFINVRDLIQIDNQFYVVLDKSGVYIYEKQYQMNSKLVFTKKADLLKILDIRTLNQNQTIQILGVTANNVFFLEKQLKDLSQNQPARFKLDYIPPSSIYLQNILQSQKSSCVGSYTIEEDSSLQLVQIDNILKSMEAKEVTQLMFNVVNDNTVIDIPNILHQLKYQTELNIIYNLQNFTCYIYLDSTYKIQSQIIKQIEFINGQLIANMTNYKSNNPLNLTFYGFQSVKLTNMQVNQNIQFKNCKDVVLDSIQFKDQPYYNIMYEQDQNVDGYISIKNIVIQTNILIDGFIFIKYAKEVKIQNIMIQRKSMKDIVYVDQRSDDLPQDSIFYFEKMHTVLIDLITIEGVKFYENLFFMGHVNNVQISNINLNDIQNIKTFDNIDEQHADEILRMSKSYAIFDIQFLEQAINILNVQAINSFFSQFFNLRNYKLNIQHDLTDIPQLLRQLSDKDSLEDDYVFSIPIKTIIDSYQQFDVIMNELYFNNITKSKQYPETQPDQNIINIYGGNIAIKQISFEQINNFHSCIYAHFGKDINISNFKATQIHQGIYVSYIQNANSLQLSQTILQQTYELKSLLSIINTPSQIRYSVFQQDFNAKDSAIYIKFDDIVNTNKITLYETQITNIISQSSGAALKLFNTFEADLELVKISNNFSNDCGGGIYAQNSNITFINVQILNNKANLSGGGMYIIDCELNIKDNQLQNESLIKSNEAKIGGGIRYFSINTPTAIQKNKYIFQQNNAVYFGDNFTFVPKNLFFPKIIGGLLLNVTSSQTKVSTNIDAVWIDEEGRTVNFIEVKTEVDNIIYQKLYEEINNYMMFQISSKQISINRELNYSKKVKGQLASDKTTINISLNLLFKPEIQSSLTIKPIFDHVPDIYLKQTQQEIEIQAIFRKCAQGEIFKQVLDNYIECERCDNNTYSLKQPSFDEKNVCLPCPESSLRCEGDQIYIKDGYWIKEGTSYIERCKNRPEKCQFQQKGINCVEGNIGPRCESCDYSNVIWKNGTYGKTGKYDCQKCEDHSFQNKQIIGSIFLVLAFGVYQVILVIKLNNTLSNVLKGMYIKKIGIINLSNTLNQNGFSTLTKFFISYLQLLQILNSFKFNFPDILNSSIYFFGNPLATSKFSFDCVLIKSTWHKHLEIVYLRLVWNVFTTICYFIITAIALFGYDYYQNREANRYMSLQSFLKYLRLAGFYMYYLVFPSFVIAFSDIISCESIGGDHYVIADNQFLCNTENHILIAYKICLPLLIIFVLAIPLYIFYKLFKNQRFSPKIFLKYGFFFLEYKETRYYWEIIKMIQKSLIYIICSALNENQIHKGAFLSLFMILYMKMTHLYKPYKKITLNNLDFFINFILLISFQLGIINIYTDDIYIQTVSLVLMFGLNLTAVFYFFKLILKQQIQLSPSSYLYPYLICLKKCFPAVFAKIFNEPKSCLISHKGWSKVQSVIKWYKPHNEPYTLNKFEQFQKVKSNYDTYRLIKSQNTSIFGKLGVNYTKSVTVQSISKLSLKKDNNTINPSIFLKQSLNNDYDESSLFNFNEQEENKYEQKLENFNFSKPKIDKLNNRKSIRDRQDSLQQFVTGANKTISDELGSKTTDINELSLQNFQKKSTSEL